MYPGQYSTGRVDDATALKYKQIDSLRQYFPTVKELTRDQLYEVANLTLPSRQTITIRIHLSPDFPRTAPILQVHPPVMHPLVDQQMNIVPAAHENLARWGVHASLGKTVYEIIQKFMQQPPQFLPQHVPHQPAQPTHPIQSYPPYPGPTPTATSQPPPAQQVKTHTPLPVIPATFPELDTKSYHVVVCMIDKCSPSELSQLLNDDREFQKFFDNLEQVKTMKDLRDALRNNVEDLSKKNLAKEGEIEKVKQEMASRMHILNEKRAAFEQKAQRQQEIMKQFSTPALIEQLGDAAAVAEHDSDAVAQKFLNGDLDQKDFIKQFLELRKLYHLRSAKKESLMMLTR